MHNLIGGRYIPVCGNLIGARYIPKCGDLIGASNIPFYTLTWNYFFFHKKNYLKMVRFPLLFECGHRGLNSRIATGYRALRLSCGSRNIPGARVRPCGRVPEYSRFPNIIVLLAKKFGICWAYVVLRSWAYPRGIN